MKLVWFTPELANTPGCNVIDELVVDIPVVTNCTTAVAARLDLGT